MNDKRYKAIEKWLDSGNTNREWEALLATKHITKWKYSTYSLSEIQAFVIIRNNKLEKILPNG